MQVQLKMTNYFYIILWIICESWTLYIKLFTIELNTMTSGYLSFEVRKWSEKKDDENVSTFVVTFESSVSELSICVCDLVNSFFGVFV